MQHLQLQSAAQEFCWLAFEITGKFVAIFALFSSFFFSLRSTLSVCSFVKLLLFDIRDSSQPQSEELRIKSFRFCYVWGLVYYASKAIANMGFCFYRAITISISNEQLKKIWFWMHNPIIVSLVFTFIIRRVIPEWCNCEFTSTINDWFLTDQNARRISVLLECITIYKSREL